MGKNLLSSIGNTLTRATDRYIVGSGSGALDTVKGNKLFWTVLFMRDSGSLEGPMAQVSFITQKQDTLMRVNFMMILCMVKAGLQKMVPFSLVHSIVIRERVKDTNAMAKGTYILVLSKMG